MEGACSTRLSVKMLLEMLDHQVVDETEAKFALVTAQQTDFDLVLTEHHLHGMTGYELCRTFKRTQLAVPVILKSGRDEPGLNEICDYFVPKSIGFDTQRRAIHVAVENCQKHHAESPDRFTRDSSESHW